MPEGKTVNNMFARIASRYDLANRVLSLGIDCGWREVLVEEVDAVAPARIIDLATGSGDVAFALEQALPRSTRIAGLDFCQPMLDEAERKKGERKSRIEFTQADALDLPIESDSVDAVTISFGFRNLEDRQRGLLEMRRILKKRNGWLFILEFSQPNTLCRPFYYFYLKRILPNIAAIFTGDKAAYQYLSDSIESFPDREGISAEIRQAGFRDVRAIPLTLGNVALHIAQA